MKTRRKSREILGENTRALHKKRQEQFDIQISGKAVENAGGPSQRTWARIILGQNCELNSVDALADYFRVEPWQLLVPDMTPVPVPYLRQGKPLTPKQEQFLEEFEHADSRAKEMALRILASSRRK